MWEGKTAGDDINFYALLGIVQCGMWLKNDIERYLLEFGLSYGRFSILLFLLEAGERKPAGIDLTAKLGIEKSTVAKMAEKLGSDGLVRGRRTTMTFARSGTP
jgi:DNA-binding MarR family transcriptional regulator